MYIFIDGSCPWYARHKQHGLNTVLFIRLFHLYMKDLGDGTRQVAIINIVQFKSTG